MAIAPSQYATNKPASLKYKKDKNYILQWNLNSLKAKIDELKILITKYQPDIIALQETKMPPNEEDPKRKLANYNFIRKDRDANGGGVALMFNKNLPYTKVNLNTTLEAVAATTYYKNIKLTICSLYLPPGCP